MSYNPLKDTLAKMKLILIPLLFTLLFTLVFIDNCQAKSVPLPDDEISQFLWEKIIWTESNKTSVTDALNWLASKESTGSEFNTTINEWTPRWDNQILYFEALFEDGSWIYYNLSGCLDGWLCSKD